MSEPRISSVGSVIRILEPDKEPKRVYHFETGDAFFARLSRTEGTIDNDSSLWLRCRTKIVELHDSFREIDVHSDNAVMFHDVVMVDLDIWSKLRTK